MGSSSARPVDLDMTLNALLLCSDEKIVRVLRRTLGDLDIGVEVCADSDSALRKLTRRRFEAIIVDCVGEGATAVLKSARSAPCNRQAVAVAIVDGAVGLKSMFDIGAHFVLYKPVSSERSKSSFRAARALMKSERRRNTRVLIQVAVVMRSRGPGANLKVDTVDLSEGGMAVNFPDRQRATGTWQIAFTLPGTQTGLELAAEFAWEGSSGQAGLRFVNISSESLNHLRDWLKTNSPDIEDDDPPVRCQLSDLSLGGCYLESSSPFPASTRVMLSMRAGGVEIPAQGVVRVMHPEKGMGVEFVQTTPEQRTSVAKFLQMLSENRSLTPELLVTPEGLGPIPSSADAAAESVATFEDPLLELFSQELLSPEAFHSALCKQRAVQSPASGASA
jgi:c-di-GMP-binding flagellar brake protein YcgR